MIVRHYSPEDFEQVKALHARQGLAYELPDLEAPAMLVRTVIEEEGRITHAAFLRKTAECYWLFGPEEKRRERLGKLIVLHREMKPSAERMNLEDIHCWIPPGVISPAMHLTMLNMGWVRPEWTCYSRKVE